MLSAVTRDSARLTESKKRELCAFLESRPSALSSQWCQGFFVAMASVPDPLNPSVWLEVILDEDDPFLGSERDAQRVKSLLIWCFRECVVNADSGQVAFSCPPSDEKDVKEWCAGYMAGVWLAEVPEDFEESPEATVSYAFLTALSGNVPDKDLRQLVYLWEIGTTGEQFLDSGWRDVDDDRVAAALSSWRSAVPEFANTCYEGWRQAREVAVPAAAKTGGARQV